MTNANDCCDMPTALVFLSPSDYKRLTPDGTQFTLNTNPADHRHPFDPNDYTYLFGFRCAASALEGVP